MSALPRLRAQSRKLLSFIVFVARRFIDDHSAQIAASLTFTTLLSLVPLITVAVTVFAAFPVFEEFSIQIKIFLLTHMVPEMAGKIITVHMQDFAAKAAKLTAVGVAFLAITALMLMQTIDRAFNGIWRVRRPRNPIQRFLTYWAVLTVGPILLGASLSATSYLVGLSLGYMKDLPGAGELLLMAVPFVLMSATFTLLYSVVPNRYVPLSHALIGGIVAGVLFELMKRAFAWYVATVPTYALVYGAFATLPVFLLWIYLSWMTVLLGAVLAAALSHWRAGTWQQERKPGWRFEAALQVLSALARVQRQGHTTRLSALCHQVDLGLEEMEELLERLRAGNYVRRAEKNGWLLSRAPQDIRLADLFHLLVFDVGSRQRNETAHGALLHALVETQDRALDGTLADLLAAPATS